jgi:hypothetical protein
MQCEPDIGPYEADPSRDQVGRRIANRRTVLLVADFAQRH